MPQHLRRVVNPRTITRSQFPQKPLLETPQIVISLLCPTRQRPEMAHKYMESVLSTASQPQRVELLFYLDFNDPMLHRYHDTVSYIQGEQQPFYDDYMGQLINEPPLRTQQPQRGRIQIGQQQGSQQQRTQPYICKGIKIIIGPRVTVGKAWNILAKECSGQILMMGNDDLIFTTKSWDTVLDIEFMKTPDKIACLFPNDGIRDNDKSYLACTFPIIHRCSYEALGYFVPECFKFYYHDSWLAYIFHSLNRLERISRFQVVHKHHTRGESQISEIAVNTGEIDTQIYKDTEGQRKNDIEKLRRLMV